MSYIPLTDPFTLQFRKDGVDYDATVIYAKAIDCAEHFFAVTVQQPEGIEPFHLKERPTPDDRSETMIWIDENDHVRMLYQVLGAEIEQHLRKNLGIVLIDAPVTDHEINPLEDKGND